MNLSHRLFVLLAIAALLFPYWYSPSVAEADVIGNVYAEHDSSETEHTGDTLWQDIVTLASSSFAGNGVYFIIAWGDGGSETAGFFSREGEHTDEQLVYGTFWPFTLTNASHTIAIASRDDSTGFNNHNHSAILALRLDAFEDHRVFTNTATINGFGVNTYGEIGEIDITPQTAGNVLFLARESVNEVGTQDEAEIRIQITGSDIIGLRGADSGTGPWQSRSFDADDASPGYIMVLESVAASSLDVDIDGKMNNAGQTMSNRTGVAFSMELAAAAEPPAAPTERRRPTLITEGSFRHHQMAA